MKRPLLFLAVCSALDELVTFRNLAVGGVEFNPRVTFLITMSPLLYPLADIILIGSAWAVDKVLSRRQVDVGILWMFAGLTRLLCFIFSLFY